MTSLSSNGYRPQDTPGDQGWKEQGQESVQQQTYQAPGSLPIRKDRYIYIENSSTKITPFLVRDVATVSEVIEKIYDSVPMSCSDSIGLRISDTRMGSSGRRVFEGELPPDVFFLHVYLYLKKHPGVPSSKN